MKKLLIVFSIISLSLLFVSFNNPFKPKIPNATEAKLSPDLIDVLNKYKAEGKWTLPDTYFLLDKDTIKNADKKARVLQRMEKRKARYEAKLREKGLGPTDRIKGEKNPFVLSFDKKKDPERPDADIIGVFIKFYGDPSFLTSYGVKIKTRVKNIVSAYVPVDRIEEIAKDSRVIYIELSRLMEPVLDKSVPATSADLIRIYHDYGIDSIGYTGKGVVVGIVDTGIDWTHADFKDPSTGKTRIWRIWDQTIDTPGRFPSDTDPDLPSLNYGTEWTNSDIDSGTCTEVDSDGHGTHVAGIAAGNGRGGAVGRYTGMAPEADIVMVKTTFYNNAILDGVAYIFEKAKDKGENAVVNLSLGMGFYWAVRNADGFDGTDLFSQSLDGLVGNGKLIVKSAGNDGLFRNTTPPWPDVAGSYHGEGNLSSTNTHYLRIPNNQEWIVRNLIWYKPTDTVRVRVIGPSSPLQPWMPSNETFGPAQTGQTGWDFGWTADIYFYLPSTPNPNNLDRYGNVSIWYSSYSAWYYYYYYIAGGNDWRIEIQAGSGGGSQNYDYWTKGYSAYLGWADETLVVQNYLHRKSLPSASSAKKLIVVGAYTTKNRWQSINGNYYQYSLLPPLHHIADFSSPGPTRDGRMKPEITAPGFGVASALSKDYSVSQPWIVEDGKHVIMQGTSMSAPHVTGAVALMLQKFGALSSTDAINLLQANATWDGYTAMYGSKPNYAFGAGKLNVRFLNEPPVAKLTASPLKGPIPLNVNFDGTGSYDTDGIIVGWIWDFGDGTVTKGGISSESKEAGLKPAHTFNKVGTFTVKLQVEDNTGDLSSPATVSIIAFEVYPPVNIALKRDINKSLFREEAYHTITWSANPENKYVTIAKYNIYRKLQSEGDDKYKLIASVSANTFQYVDKKLDPKAKFHYALTSVDTDGNESKKSSPVGN